MAQIGILEEFYDITLSDGTVDKFPKCMIIGLGLTRLKVDGGPINPFNYETIVETWETQNSIPLEQDIITAGIAEYEYRLKLRYIDYRRNEYPPIVNYIDGVVKGDQAQIQKYIDDCNAVKAKYPKPEDI